MKFLILFALVAAASADYHDDTFHFSNLGQVSGLQKGAFIQASAPLLTKKYTTFAQQPAFAGQYTTVQAAPAVYTQQVAAPVLVKSIEEEIPAFSQKYTAELTKPVYSQQYAVKQFAQPAVFAQQYAVKQLAQPAVFPQQYAFKQVAQPVYSQYSAVKEIAQPVYSQYSTVKEIAQPVYSQYSAVKEIAQPVYSQYSAIKPVYSQQYAVKQIAKPVYSQYSAVKEIAQPVYSQYSAFKQVAQPVISQYSAVKPVIAEQPALSGVSTYASAYQGPQYRILSYNQEADTAGPYKVSYSTENGIQASEEGTLIEGAEGPVVAKQGFYSYTGPDGVVYTVNYTADENGFRAVGDHLPTPSAEILKSLEENAASGEQYDEEGKLLKK